LYLIDDPRLATRAKFAFRGARLRIARPVVSSICRRMQTFKPIFMRAH
jgi:hypothetical protein